MSRYGAFQIGGGGVAAVLLLFPIILPEIKIHLAIEILIFALLAVSFNLLLGYGGMLAFGHAAPFGVGAYAAALSCNHLPGMPLLVTLLIAALSGFVGALFIGFFCVRLKGAYFALITLAFQMFLFAAALKWRSVTRGDDGMGVVRPELYLPGLGSISLMNIHNLYYLTLVLVVVGIVACYLFLRTPLGNAVMCMRENDVRASFLGYDVFLTKLTVFSFAGLLAGLAGGLFVLFQEFVATTAIDVNRSFAALLMTVIGGTGHFLGPVLGAIFYTVFQDWISSLTKHWILFMGILFVIVVMYLEGGLISLLKWERIRVWVSGQKE
jgi:branched-chain amino acid transport system permease protein